MSDEEKRRNDDTENHVTVPEDLIPDNISPFSPDEDDDLSVDEKENADENEPEEDRENDEESPEQDDGSSAEPDQKDKDRHFRSDDDIEIDRADEGLAVGFSHDGTQKTDELLKSKEEREKEEEEESPEEIEGFDEEEEKEKKEKNLLKDKERRKKEKDSYRRQQDYYRRQEEAAAREAAKSEQEEAYERMLRGDQPAGIELVEESDSDYFKNISRTFIFDDKGTVSEKTADEILKPEENPYEQYSGISPAGFRAQKKSKKKDPSKGIVDGSSGSADSPVVLGGHADETVSDTAAFRERELEEAGPEYFRNIGRTFIYSDNGIVEENNPDNIHRSEDKPYELYEGVSSQRKPGPAAAGKKSAGSGIVDNRKSSAMEPVVLDGANTGRKELTEKDRQLLAGKPEKTDSGAGVKVNGVQRYGAANDSEERRSGTMKTDSSSGVPHAAGVLPAGSSQNGSAAGNSNGKLSDAFRKNSGAVKFGAGREDTSVKGQKETGTSVLGKGAFSAAEAASSSRIVRGRGIIENGIFLKGIIGREAYLAASRNFEKTKEENKKNAFSEVPGLRMRGMGQASKPVQVGPFKWELEKVAEEKERRALEGLHTTSATEEYYSAVRAKNGMIRMKKDSGIEKRSSYGKTSFSGIAAEKPGGGIRGEGSVNGLSVTDVRGADKIRTDRALVKSGGGALAKQSEAAKKASGRIFRFLTMWGIGNAANDGQDKPAAQATEALTEKLKKAMLTIAKKAVAGTTAIALGAGAAAGTGTYSFRNNNTVNTYYYPIQAHTDAEEGGDTTMTQEVLTGMHQRMRAYGLPVEVSGTASAGNGTIRIHVPGYDTSFRDYREGDCQVITDGNGNCLIIDGGCGILSKKMIEYLQQQSIKNVNILVTHWHEDHSYGFIKMLNEASEIHVEKLFCIPPSETNSWDYSSHGERLISAVQQQGGQVIEIAADRPSTVKIGSLNMIMWRKGNPSSGFPTTHVNDMSIQVYFPDLYYYTTGDIISEMDDFLDAIKGYTIKCVKTPHHGNGSRLAMKRLREEFGTEIAWDNNVNRGAIHGLSSFEYGTSAAVASGMQTIETDGDIEFVAEGGMMRITGNGKTFSYPIPYTGGGTSAQAGTIMKQVCDYAASWEGKIPYKSSVTHNDPNNERFMDLKEGRGSDCSWFVYHVLKHFNLVGDEFIHSYEWGNKPECYPKFKNVGTDVSTAQPGDVFCTGKGTASGNSHVGIFIGNGKWVECAAGAGVIISDAPSNPRQIVRYSGAGVTSTMGGSPSNDSKYGFTPETEAIVESQMDKFNYHNFDSFMAQYGGANEQGVINYLKSLGGVFAKHAGEGPVMVTSAGEFQEMAEFIMGMYAIWGPDYEGAGYAVFIDENDPSRFYTGMDKNGKGDKGGDEAGWICGMPLEEMLSYKRHAFIDCGSGATQLIWRTMIAPDNGYAGKSRSDAESWIQEAAEVYGCTGGTIIHDKSELQVGDVIQMGHSGEWHHVCVVGEVWADGTVITYETGHRFVADGNYKSIFNPNPSGDFPSDSDYPGYEWWYGVRLRPITQTDGLSGMGIKGAATKNLKEIKINSVKVNGSEISKDSVKWNTLSSFTYNGNSTSGVTKTFKFVDRLGNVLGTASSGGLGASSAGGIGGIAATGKAADVIRVAESHMGGPYVYGGNSWENGIDCSHFVTRVLQEAGVYDGGYMTSYGWADYGREVPDIEHAQAGDIVISNNRGHVSIYDGVKWVYEAKGRAYGCVHDRLPGNIDTIRRILPDGGGTSAVTPTGSTSGSAVNNTPSGQGQTIEIPEGLGTKYLYMYWQDITAVSSNQYRLKAQAGMNFDSEGFGVVNGRYVVAATSTYGEVGDYVDFYNTNGLIFHCIIGEAKSSHDSDYNKWGHRNGDNILEFCVDENTWKGLKDNPGTASNHPEWAGSINKAVNLGSYFDDPNAINLLSSGSSINPMSNTNSIGEAAMYLCKQILSMSALGSYYAQPDKIDDYGKYCYDLIDYAICESHGADVEYTSSWDGSMRCSATVTVICSLPLLEDNDQNFVSWEIVRPDGDLMPTNYMGLSKKDFELIFNVDTTVRSSTGAMMSGDPGFTGVAKQVYDYLKSKGYGPAQIAGIMANIEKESHFDPKADNGTHEGLIQWGDGRLRALKDLANSKGLPYTDVSVQLDYLYEEVHGGSGWNGRQDIKNKFESTTDPYEAGALFSKYFERMGVESEHAARGELAKEYYNKIVNAGMTMASSNINYVNWAIQTANDNTHGYSMGGRTGNPDYDCSSFVFYALKNSGYDVGDWPFSTDGMPSTLQRLGFTMIPFPSEDQLQPGDIMWWDGSGSDGHTEIYIGNGQRVGAHGCHGENRSPAPGDSGDEVSVKPFDRGSYTHIFRKTN